MVKSKVDEVLQRFIRFEEGHEDDTPRCLGTFRAAPVLWPQIIDSPFLTDEDPRAKLRETPFPNFPSVLPPLSFYSEEAGVNGRALPSNTFRKRRQPPSPAPKVA